MQRMNRSAPSNNNLRTIEQQATVSVLRNYEQVMIGVVVSMQFKMRVHDGLCTKRQFIICTSARKLGALLTSRVGAPHRSVFSHADTRKKESRVKGKDVACSLKHI